MIGYWLKKIRAGQLPLQSPPTMNVYRTGLETERLLHRTFTVEDAERVYALNSDPDVMRLPNNQ